MTPAEKIKQLCEGCKRHKVITDQGISLDTCAAYDYPAQFYRARMGYCPVRNFYAEWTGKKNFEPPKKKVRIGQQKQKKGKK